MVGRFIVKRYQKVCHIKRCAIGDRSLRGYTRRDSTIVLCYILPTVWLLISGRKCASITE